MDRSTANFGGDDANDSPAARVKARGRRSTTNNYKSSNGSSQNIDTTGSSRTVQPEPLTPPTKEQVAAAASQLLQDAARLRVPESVAPLTASESLAIAADYALQKAGIETGSMSLQESLTAAAKIMQQEGSLPQPEAMTAEKPLDIVAELKQVSKTMTTQECLATATNMIHEAAMEPEGMPPQQRLAAAASIVHETALLAGAIPSPGCEIFPKQGPSELLPVSRNPTAVPIPEVAQQGSTNSSDLWHVVIDGIMDWQPARLLHRDSFFSKNQFALLVLNQPVEKPLMLYWVWEKAFFRIAADGAANRLQDAARDARLTDMFAKLALDAICGDLDSVDPLVTQSALRRGTKVIKISDQNSTDFEKCVNYLRTEVFPVPAMANNIVCLGGLGGRVDHGLSQLHTLYKEQINVDYNDGLIFLLTSESLTFVLKSGKHRIRVKDSGVSDVLGTHVGIIPLKGPSTITTKGLEWDVTDWLTEFGGQISTSNLVRESVVEITTSGDVLFTIEVDFAKGQREWEEFYSRPIEEREALRIADIDDTTFMTAVRHSITGRIFRMEDDCPLTWRLINLDIKGGEKAGSLG